MANPLIDTEDYIFGAATDHYGDHYAPNCNVHVAGMILLAGAFIVALKVSGFRAMVGVGRG